MEVPVGADNTPVTLEALFADTYPWFPPTVYDRANRLRLGRHRDHATGLLCLVEANDWHLNTTLAEHLEEQLPKLMFFGRRNRAHRAELPLAAAGDPGFQETRLPEPTGLHLAFGQPAITIQDVPVPRGLEHGGLVVRMRLGPRGEIGPSTVEVIAGDDFRAENPVSQDWLRNKFPIVSVGYWKRLQDFTPGESALHLWERLTGDLPPLEFGALAAEPHIVPAEVCWLGLLVPTETTYERFGERWIFLVRATSRDGTTAAGFVDAQHARWGLPNERTPEATALATKSVAIVGLGALGSVVAADLARTGIGQLHLIDPDVVDTVGAAARQPAPVSLAGIPKVDMQASRLRSEHPMLDITTHVVRLGSGPLLYGPDRTREHADANRAIANADLVIDAAANLPVTRWLSALQLARRKPFLHLSATAGVWGGVIALLNPNSGCWACVEHHRFTEDLRIPPADPDGTIAPVGCAEHTFTGTSADIGVVAHEGSRLAIRNLCESLEATYQVATLRDEHGNRQPAAWTCQPIPLAPECKAPHISPEEVPS